MTHMILAICNTGYADEVMEVAKSVGARGGTILHGRGSVQKDALQFLSITIEPEKEVVIIIVGEERDIIMQAIATNLGVGTKAHTVCLSLPVDSVAGLNI